MYGSGATTGMMNIPIIPLQILKGHLPDHNGFVAAGATTRTLGIPVQLLASMASRLTVAVGLVSALPGPNKFIRFV